MPEASRCDRWTRAAPALHTPPQIAFFFSGSSRALAIFVKSADFGLFKVTFPTIEKDGRTQQSNGALHRPPDLVVECNCIVLDCIDTTDNHAFEWPCG